MPGVDGGIVVIGAGMVAHRFVEGVLGRLNEGEHVTVIGEERRAPYDRVALTTYFTGSDPSDLMLDPAVFADPRVTFRRGERVVEVQPDAARVITSTGDTVSYEHLVLATGSYATTPDVPGSDLQGSFVYRTLDDVQAIRRHVTARSARLRRPLRGAVIGGGLLGLEAAGALEQLGVECTVVQSADRLMSAQLDTAGGAALGRLIRARGLQVRTDSRTTGLRADHDREEVTAVEFGDGSSLAADIVVFTIGVRPRDELARAAGLATDAAGGVVIDAACRTSVPGILAIGEVASFQGRCVGLVAPGYAMAEVAVRTLRGEDAAFGGFDDSAKLKLHGVEVASFGDAFARTPDALDVVYADPVAGVYKKLVLSDDAKTLLGGILVGDASAYGTLRPLVGTALGGDPAAFLLPADGIDPPNTVLPDDAVVCSCSNVTAGRIRQAVHEEGCRDAAAVRACTRAGATCGSCVLTVGKVVKQELTAMGEEVSAGLCEHFDLTRRQVFDAIRVSGLSTFSATIERFGRGRGCDVCKPVIAGILSVLTGVHVLDAEIAALQDTNDHVMANLQKDGTYSVVPRMPGGEVTPAGLIAIGRIADDYGLYTKLTGGQRIDMFGARLEQLPQIWHRLIDAGFESGHAYGKSLRTVKSCVGSTWCRYGVQDSVGMAVRLELRYRGLRSPHKLKVGVSGCARECAEARGKDVGVIATEHGWNMYVGGNGGATPKHAQLLASGLDDDALITAIDRFFMYYIRTADRLQRTAPWLDELEGGLDTLREVLFDDALGICVDMDAAMARHVERYEDEWAATLRDPEKLRRFSSFVNAADTPDPALAYVAERGQARPATEAERGGAVRIAGTILEVRA